MKNHRLHLTADALTFYTRFRQNIVSLSGSAAAASAASSSWTLLARDVWFVQVKMAVRPLQTFLSEGTPFANCKPLSSEKGISGWFYAKRAKCSRRRHPDVTGSKAIACVVLYRTVPQISQRVFNAEGGISEAG